MADARNMIRAGAAPGALAPLPASTLLPSLVTNSGERARVRFLEFFAGQIRNPHTRRAYGRAAAEFLAWCLGAGVTSLPQVQPMHVAAWIELQRQDYGRYTDLMESVGLFDVFHTPWFNGVWAVIVCAQPTRR